MIIWKSHEVKGRPYAILAYYLLIIMIIIISLWSVINASYVISLRFIFIHVLIENNDVYRRHLGTPRLSVGY